MTHTIVIFVGAELLPMEAREGSGIAAKVVVLLVYAALLLAATYLLVERPSRDAWRSRLVGPRPVGWPRRPRSGRAPSRQRRRGDLHHIPD